MKIEWRQVAVALSLGLFLGTALGRVSAWRQWAHAHGHKKMVERFSKQLKLDEGQKPKVEAILAAKREKMKALRDKARPPFEALRKSASAEIRALLRPEQIERLDELEARLKAKHEERRARLEKE